ncbi:hypothetical protein LZ009_22085 [Ramlibacter sp. XY19]|uniref:hypothetical protein n=1 Tax=Ramlibacter paludis TaxID=2908000 RepID=UPI0023D9EFA5|nr:hypothetical protein [Ramlibacter paludis]MCG2595476.1 hypothetical protein [Ramlibacter paludis]
MVMFKAKFEPQAGDKPRASDKPREGEKRRAQQQQQPQPKVPPIEEERGPQNPVKLPGQPHEPERA